MYSTYVCSTSYVNATAGRIAVYTTGYCSSNWLVQNLITVGVEHSVPSNPSFKDKEKQSSSHEGLRARLERQQRANGT